MARARVAAAAALLVAGLAAGQDVSNFVTSPAVGLGPLELRSQSPLNILRLTPTPRSPVTLAAGQWQLELLTSWNNYFDYDPQYYTIDAETLRFTMNASYGVTSRLELTASLPLSYRGGGIMDRFIENFEGLLHVANKDRKLFPRNRYLVLIHGTNGRTFELTGEDAGWGIEDATVGARYRLADGTASTPAVTATFVLKIPTGRSASLYSSGGYDFEAGVSAGQRLGRRFNVYAALGAMHYASDDMVGVRLKPNQISLFTGVEYRHSPRMSWLLQALVTSAGAEQFGGFSKNTYEITVGLKRVLNPNLLLEASLLENLFIFDNSPDVGFHVGLVWRSNRPRGKG